MGLVGPDGVTPIRQQQFRYQLGPNVMVVGATPDELFQMSQVMDPNTGKVTMDPQRFAQCVFASAAFHISSLEQRLAALHLALKDLDPGLAEKYEEKVNEIQAAQVAELKKHGLLREDGDQDN